MPSASILITGLEVLDGRVHDSNSFYLINALQELGIDTEHVLTCGDSTEAIVSCLSFLSSRSRLIIVSGGLGPTTDDLTREAAAEFAGVRLTVSQEATSQIIAFFERRRRKFDPSNNKQALLPEGATLIPNPAGSAPGFVLTAAGKMIVAVPGVPEEIRAMWQSSVSKIVSAILPECTERTRKRTVRIFGLGESDVGARVEASAPGESVIVSYRAAFPEVQVGFRGASAETAQEVIDAATARAVSRIGADKVFSNSLGVGMEDVVVALLEDRKATLAVAESCTGGMLGETITRVPGSSSSFLGGVITYSNELKVCDLDVPRSVLTTFGAVSAQVAEAMAAGVLARTGAHIGVAITGIAGPGGGTAEKPVGTFFVGLADRSGASSHYRFFPSTRERVRVYACYTALDLLRRKLGGLALAAA